VLAVVFPLDAQGLRSLPQRCWACPARHLCLRTALDSPDGQVLRAKAMERGRPGGLAAGLRRWSRLKELRRTRGGKR